MSKLSKEFVIIVSGKTIARCLDFDLEINKETIDLTTLDSGSWREILGDQKSWSVSFNALIPRTVSGSTATYADLLEHIKADGAGVTIAVGEKAQGGKYEEGVAILTSLSASFSVGDTASFSGTLEGTGALETKTVS